jgi:hypothetical protein
MPAAAREFADRVWAVEGCGGIGRRLAHRLVQDGEIVFGVPPELSAQVRVFATVKPRGLAGKTRRRPAAELTAGLEAIGKKARPGTRNSPGWSPPAGPP